MKEWIVPDDDIGVDGAYFDYKELIRCKDCLYNLQIGTDIRCILRQGLKGKMCADDYCSRAVREEE